MGIPKAVLDRAEKAEKLQKEAEKQEAVQGTPEPEKVADTPDYKHKYEVLQGKFNAQARDLTAQAPQLQQVSDQLEAERVKTAEIQAQLLQAQSELSEANSVRTLSDDAQTMRDVFPDEAAEVWEKREKIIKEQERTIKALADRLDKMEEGQKTITTTQAEDSWEKFMGEVKGKITGIHAINIDPEFGEWVAERYPGTVYTRQQLLEQAAEQYDSQAAIHIYSEWVSRNGAQPSSLESQVTFDGKASSGKPSEKKVYTREEVKEFYQRHAMGKYKEAEGARIDKDITAAQTEGRIR